MAQAPTIPRRPCRPRAGGRSAVPDKDRAAALVQIGLGQRQRLLNPQPGAPQHDDQRVETMAVASMRSLAHDRHDLIGRRRVGEVALALVARGYPDAAPWRGRRRTAPAGGRPAAAEQMTWLPPLRAGTFTRQLYRPAPSQPEEAGPMRRRWISIAAATRSGSVPAAARPLKASVASCYLSGRSGKANSTLEMLVADAEQRSPPIRDQRVPAQSAAWLRLKRSRRRRRPSHGREQCRHQRSPSSRGARLGRVRPDDVAA